MSAIRSVGAERANASALAAELHEIERANAPSPVELPAELVRLGAALPGAAVVSHRGAVAAPDLGTLREVARIGTHLGGLERAQGGLPEAEAGYVSERLARARVLVDCASALADLRASVSAAMRTARPA